MDIKQQIIMFTVVIVFLGAASHGCDIVVAFRRQNELNSVELLKKLLAGWKYETSPEEGDRTVISLPSKKQAKAVLNLLNRNTNILQARLKDSRTPEVFCREELIESSWNDILEQSKITINEHERKIEEAAKIVDHAYAVKKKNMKLEEIEARLKSIKVKQSILDELCSQKKEFGYFMERLKSKLDKLPTGRLVLKEVEEIKNEFSNELKKLTNALPIYSKKSDIIKMIQEKQVTILTAETGSGKSTQVVQYLHQAGYGATGMIACTQPRKVAAVSLAKRVAEEMDSTVGESVGYCVGMQRKQSNTTSVLFMTDHILLNECLGDPILRRYSCIIVDEAHERSISTDLLLAMIKKALIVRPEFRLVISSATIDPAVFLEYFQELASQIHVHGRTFPVEIAYEVKSKRTEYFHAVVAKAKQVHKTEEPGDVLVFLTTPNETEKAQEIIKSDESIQAQVHCLVLHGRLPSEEQQLVFNPSPPGKRKIVFATNSAETSITIPNIRFVIDCGMVKEKYYNSESNTGSLRVGPINKSSAEQRMGRAGRTQDGKCFRLFTLDEYNLMSDEMLPEILRENLGLALLKLYQMQVRHPLDYDFVQAPAKEALNKANDELVSLGAISDESLTEHGRIMATVEVEPRLAKFVALSIETGVTLGGMVVAAICTVGGNVFFRVGTEEEKQIADQYKARFCSHLGDTLTLLEVYKEWSQQEECNKNKWCVANSMNAKTLRFTRDLVYEMKSNLEKLLEIKIDNNLANLDKATEIMPMLLARCFSKNVAFFSGHLRGGYYRPSYTGERFFLHPSSSLSFLSMTPKWVLYQEILTTTRPYLINVTVLPDVIGEGLVEDVQHLTVELIHKRTVGKETANRLGLGRWNGKLEKQMQLDVHIDVYIEFDVNTGEVSLYCLPALAQETIDYLTAAIDGEVEKLRSKVLDLPLSGRSPISVVIQQGGEITELLCASEYISVLVGNVTKDNADKKDMERLFAEYGTVSEVICFNKPGSYIWGKITFTSHTTALRAVNAFKNADEGSMTVKGDLKGKPRNLQASQEFVIKTSWTRRRGKGYAFLSFDNICVTDEFVSQRSAYVGPTIYQFSRSRKNPNDLRVVGINPYYSKDEIISAFENQFPNVKVKDCVVPRNFVGKESDDVIMQVERQLSMGIANHLDQSDIQDRHFSVRVYPPRNEKDFDLKGVLKFKRVRDGQTILSSNLTVGLAMVRLAPELRYSMTVSSKLYYLLEDELALLPERTENANITIRKMQNRKEILFEITIESKLVEHLAEARHAVHSVVNGTSNQCSEREFRYFRTPVGRRFIDHLQATKACMIQIDYRNRSMTVYALKKSMDYVLSKIEGKKGSITADEDSLVIYLGKDEFPKGFIKLLLSTYGVTFEGLCADTGVNYIDISFLRHTLEIYGKYENLQKCKELILHLIADVSEATEKTIATKTCPICFDSMETKSYQLEVCAHSYCKECLQNMCEHAVKNNNLPIECAADECDEKVCISDTLCFIDNSELVTASVEQFIARNKKSHSYCLTPNCKMIYRKSIEPNPDPYQCSECHILICTFCNVEHHANISCGVYGRRDDDSLKTWLSESGEDRGICPNCSAPIERYEGCMHMTCALCKKHVCWKCKRAVFNEPGECYAHLGHCSG